MPAKVLFVDDEAGVLNSLRRSLYGRYDLVTAVGGESGLAALERDGPFAVVVSDMRMPEMDGTAFLARVRDRSPDTIRLLLTGHADLNDAIAVVNEGGIFRFLTKPCPTETLVRHLDEALEQYRLVTAERELLDQTLRGSIRVLVEIASVIDPIAYRRALSMKNLVRELADPLGLKRVWELEIAAMLSSIGEVTVPRSVLRKAREQQHLSPVEKEMLDRVPVVGHELLRNIPRLEGIADIIHYHQRGFDGSGSPAEGLSGKRIPFGARLLKILSDMTELERKGINRFRALAFMVSQATRYDSALLAKVRRHLIGAEATAADGHRPDDIRMIAIDRLSDGMILAADIVTEDNHTLLKAGEQINAAVLMRLHNWRKLVGIREPVAVREPNGAAPS